MLHKYHLLAHLTAEKTADICWITNKKLEHIEHSIFYHLISSYPNSEENKPKTKISDILFIKK